MLGLVPSESDAATSISPQTGLHRHDDDLINYDSDDATLAVPVSRHASQHDGTRVLEFEEFAIGTVPPLQASSNLTQSSSAVGSVPLESGGTATNTTDYDHSIEPSNAPESAPSIHGPDENEEEIPDHGDEIAADETAHVMDSIHEIDYEHDDIDYAVPSESQQNTVSASTLSKAPNSPAQATDSAAEELHDHASHFEIDWDEDEPPRDSLEEQTETHDASKQFTVAAHDTASSNDQGTPGSGRGELGSVDGPSVQGALAVQDTSYPEGIPEIFVQYQGEQCPFFSQSADGFFADAHILKEPMAVVLAELREMLESEIDEQDELVFQVDKLGLEFCESSPHDSLATITLSQILDVFEILTKNEDPESSRRLSAYLFTRPNTMKRFEFLMEGATVGNTKLEDVAYYFEPPGDGSPPMEFDVDEIYGEEIDHFEALGEADEPDAKNEFVGGSDVQDRDVGTANDNAADLYGDDGVDYSIGEDKIVNDEGNADISSLEPAAVGQGESICETGPAKTAPQHDAGFDPNNTVSQAFADHDDDLIDYSDDKIADLTETRHDQRAEGVPDTTTTSLQVDGPSQQDDDLVSYADDKISVSGATSHGVGRTSSAGNKSSSPGENGAGINCGDEKMEISGDVASIGGDDAKQLQVEEIAIKNVEEPSQHGFEETDLEVTSYHGKEVVDGSSLDQFNQPLEIMMTSHDAASNAVVDALPLGPVESLSSGYRSGEKVTTELDVSVADESTRVEHIRNPSDMSIAFTAAGDESVRAAGANSGSGTSAELEVDPQAESAHAEGMPSLETESHIAVATITPDLNTAMAAVVKDDELGAMMGTNLPGNIDELSEIDWQDDDAVDVVTDMAEVLPSATKRGCPGVDEDDRNDVKRRRS